MGIWISDDVLDAGLHWLRQRVNCLVLCTDMPTNYAEAWSTTGYKIDYEAHKFVESNRFACCDGSNGGRSLYWDYYLDLVFDEIGDLGIRPRHIAFVNTHNEELLYVMPVKTPPANSYNYITVPDTWRITIEDASDCAVPLPIPPPATWTSHFDNTEWSPFPGAGIWVSGPPDYWQSENYFGQQKVTLDVIGSWYSTYHPTKMRVTVTGMIADNTVTLYGWGCPNSCGTIASGIVVGGILTCDITWPSGHPDAWMRSLGFMANTPITGFNVTNIEFYG